MNYWINLVHRCPISVFLALSWSTERIASTVGMCFCICPAVRPCIRSRPSCEWPHDPNSRWFRLRYSPANRENHQHIIRPIGFDRFACGLLVRTWSCILERRSLHRMDRWRSLSKLWTAKGEDDGKLVKIILLGARLRWPLLPVSDEICSPGSVGLPLSAQ